MLDSNDECRAGRGNPDNRKLCAANIPHDPLGRVMAPRLDQLIMLALECHDVKLFVAYSVSQPNFNGGISHHVIGD